MPTRRIDRDHLTTIASAQPLALIHIAQAKESNDPLRFWTAHKKPCLIDLTEFASGRAEAHPGGGAKKWQGGFSGRAQFILQLAPAIREKLQEAAVGTVENFCSFLRIWWRLFDRLESQQTSEGHRLNVVSSVQHLSHLHGALALQEMNPSQFATLTSVANMTREKLGLPNLHWQGPETWTRRPSVVATFDQAKPLYDALKSGWFKALDRWSAVDELVIGVRTPSSECEHTYLANAAFISGMLDADATRPHPSADEVVACYRRTTGMNRKAMNKRGLSATLMYQIIYPNGAEIRFAFHTALAGSAWNPSTLIALEVEPDAEGDARMPFLIPHPANTAQETEERGGRYILTGHKGRGDSFPDIIGSYKASKSPGMIVRTLVERTWRMRQEVVRQLALEVSRFAAVEGSHDQEATDAARERIETLRQQSRSVWLYADCCNIAALTDENYSHFGSKGPWLAALIKRLNSERSAATQIPAIVASDFRDVFAAWTFRETDGDVLAVQKELGHQQTRTTMSYLDQTVLNHESAKLLVELGDALWSQLAHQGKIDATLLRHAVEEGQVTSIQLARLDEYRALKRSRIGVGCKDPLRPSSKVDVGHVPGNMCCNHRCVLCDQAVPGPDSMDGLAMRIAELESLKSSTPMSQFSQGGDSSYASELQNLNERLSMFESGRVASAISTWAHRIADGQHVVPDLFGQSAAIQRSF